MARMRNAVYCLHTRKQTVWTTDKNVVATAYKTGLVPVFRLHKDGYLRSEFRKLVSIDAMYQDVAEYYGYHA